MIQNAIVIFLSNRVIFLYKNGDIQTVACNNGNVFIGAKKSFTFTGDDGRKYEGAAGKNKVLINFFDAKIAAFPDIQADIEITDLIKGLSLATDEISK